MRNASLVFSNVLCFTKFGNIFIFLQSYQKNGIIFLKTFAGFRFSYRPSRWFFIVIISIYVCRSVTQETTNDLFFDCQFVYVIRIYLALIFYVIAFLIHSHDTRMYAHTHTHTFVCLHCFYVIVVICVIANSTNLTLVYCCCAV